MKLKCGNCSRFGNYSLFLRSIFKKSKKKTFVFHAESFVCFLAKIQNCFHRGDICLSSETKLRKHPWNFNLIVTSSAYEYSKQEFYFALRFFYTDIRVSISKVPKHYHSFGNAIHLALIKSLSKNIPQINRVNTLLDL